MSIQYPVLPAGPGILAAAREQVLERGDRLTEAQILQLLWLPDEKLGELLALAHEVRLKWCGPAVEVEGIVSLKTGGCPEDCHFCSQSGQFASPVRSAWLNVPKLVEAARQTRATGATEFCIVAAVRGPDARLMSQLREGVAAIRAAVDIQAFRLALLRTILRYAGGRELTLGDLGTRDGLLGGINAMIVGNYLTTLGRSPEADLALLADLRMPIESLSATL